VKSLEVSRSVDEIEVFLKENKTVEFVINGSSSQDILQEVKQDIHGELCVVSALNKCVSLLYSS
jgi:hypothetical protein